jgi:putative redox protein
MTTDVRLRMEAGLRFAAETGSGFKIAIDSPVGEEAASAASPMEVQLVALGGCTAMDVISVLRKMRQDVSAYDVALAGERATEHPRVYTSILMTHTVRGTGIAEASVRRAIELSMTKYCPVFGMLYPKVDIRERYEIVDDATQAATVGEVALPGTEAGTGQSL